MAYFPLFIELDQKKVLAVGAGTVGARRIRALADFGADVTVVALRPDETVVRLAEEGRVKLLRGSYEKYRSLLWPKAGEGPPFFLVLTATGDPQADSEVMADGRAAGAFVNCAGDKRQSEFYFPGLARAGQLTAGVIAGGTSHSLAKKAANRIQEVLRTENLKLTEDKKENKKENKKEDKERKL